MTNVDKTVLLVLAACGSKTKTNKPNCARLALVGWLPKRKENKTLNEQKNFSLCST